MSNRSFLRRGGEGADAPTPRQSDQTGNAACRGCSGGGSRSSTSRRLAAGRDRSAEGRAWSAGYQAGHQAERHGKGERGATVGPVWRASETAQRGVGDWVVYRKPRRGDGQPGYFAVARLRAIESDPRNAG